MKDMFKQVNLANEENSQNIKERNRQEKVDQMES